MSYNDERLEALKRIRMQHLWRLAQRWRIPSEDTHDLVQDALLAVFYYRGELRNPEGLAFNILRNKCVHYWRERRQRITSGLEDAVSRESTPEILEIQRILFHQPLKRPRQALEFVSLLVPRRIAEEEIGDALEQIHRLSCLGRPRWQLWLKVMTTLFWVLINSIREITSAVRGRASAKS